MSSASSALVSAKNSATALVSSIPSVPSAQAISNAAPRALTQPAESLSRTLHAPSSFLQRRVFASLPLSVAQSRLKLNLFVLALVSLGRTVFTPYIQSRRGVVWAVDEWLALGAGPGGRRGRWGENGVWWLETIITLITLWNIAEAYLSVQSPAPAIQAGSANQPGLVLTPSRVSSPLTRAYPSSPSSSTPRQNPGQGPQAQTSTYQPSAQTPTRSSQLSAYPTQFQLQTQPLRSGSSPLSRTAQGELPHPHRSSSPLSASTARALDIPLRARESTGLFYPDDVGASPSKVGRTQAQGTGQGPSQGQTPRGGGSGGAGTGGDFVMVEREEKEWVDNVWKGVRGKGGRLG